MASSQRLEPQNVLPRRNGFPAADAYPATAKFKFGNGRPEEVCFAADVTAGAEGHLGKLATFLANANTPALLF